MIITYFVKFILLLLHTIQSKLFDDNITLYEVVAYNNRERAILNSIHIKDDYVYFLNGISNKAAVSMNIAARSNAVAAFEKKLNDYTIRFSYADYKEEFPQFNDIHKFNITKQFFYPDQINSWIQNKLKQHQVLSRKLIARSTEQRSIYLLKVSTGPKKCAVFILGGVIARDWISAPVILNTLEHFLETKEFDMLTNFYDFYFLPMLNPDGYEYTLTEDRFWSKNRRSFKTRKKCQEGHIAQGVNLERNWWVIENIADVCNSVYAGSQELSEEEIRNTAVELNALAERLMAFINVRGFGRLITIPYAYTGNPTNNHDLMMEILASSAEAVQEKHDVTYFYGTDAAYFYNFSGDSSDWVKSKLNVPIVYSVFLQHEDNYFPDPTHIEPLTHQFLTILNHSLSIAQEIYGPLFNTSRSAAIFPVDNFVIFHSGFVFIVTYYVVM